jgi:hypothetical protein
MKLPTGTIKISKLISSNKTGQWCQISYPNHPNGCPNYGRKHNCPPFAIKLTNILDIDRPIYIVYSEFNLRNHILKMKNRHPQWTARQLRNVLYWQGTSRKQLKERVKVAQYVTGCNFISYCPEGQGINVYTTCIKNGLKLEKIRYLNICRHVALLGFKSRWPTTD